jgi:hypothetical protein
MFNRSMQLGAFLALLLGLAQPTAARELPQRKKKTVAVLPSRLLDAPCDHLFASSLRTHRTDSKKVVNGMVELLTTRQAVEVRDFVSLRRRVTARAAYREKVVIARERYFHAKELYDDLRLEDAEKNLRRAVELLDSVYYDLVEPEAFSEILLLLGITLMEKGDAAVAHTVLKRSLFLNPHMRLNKGYYPALIEKSLGTACEDLRQSIEKEIPLLTVQRTVRFMELYKLDTLFFPVVTAKEAVRSVLVVVFERSTKSITTREEVLLLEEGDDLNFIDLFVSRWAACAPFKLKKKPPQERHRFYLSAAYQHLIFADSPTRSILHSMGFSFESGFYFVKTFGLLGKLQFMSALPDKYEDIQGGPRSARFLLGPSFALSGNWWRIFISPGIELHYLGSFSDVRDPNCKLFDAQSDGYLDMCDQTGLYPKSKDYPVDFLGGVNIYVGSQFFFINKLFVSAGLSVSSYFLPVERPTEMNFPFAAEVGGGIVF